MAELPERVRIDKWLWAARFFKTRRLAAEAVEGGKVHVDGARIKPSRALRGGERLEIRRGHERWEVEVLALSERRGPASIARTLYRETPESLAARTAAAEQRRLAAVANPESAGRPDKRARRQWRRLTGR